MSGKKTSLRSVINEVTKGKLSYLEKQKLTLKTLFTPILEKSKNPDNKASLKFLKEIYSTLISAQGDNPVPEITNDLSVFLNWIKEDDQDASIYFGSSRLVETWIKTLVKHIEYRIEKCEYSCLYANVMSQYMENNPDEVGDGTEELSSDKSTPALATKEETIKEFSRLVLSDSENFDKKNFEDFLNIQLFNTEDPIQKDVLNKTREAVNDFCKSFKEKMRINTSDLKTCIDGLLRENFLGNDKIKTLKELRENSEALEEVSTLLDKRIKNFTQWSWPQPVVIDFRRNMAGRYRAYMEEDIITAIILHYLGAKWSITLKSQFMEIYNSSMWKRGTDLGMGEPYYNSTSIEAYRRTFHKESFLSILPNKLEDLSASGAGYDDDSDDDDSRYRNRNQQHKPQLVPMEVKKMLLHLISNEIHLNNVLRPSKPLTVVQTDVEWFGPSIVHEAVLSTMKFFGATPEWLDFFRKFLETPIRVGSPKAPVQTRKRGSPISHTFTALFGETLLFIMDLYVNQVSGINIHRIHDDFWFWSHNSESVTKAWGAMQTFTKLADLKLNVDKSASVVCTSDAKPDTILPAPEPLPRGNVKWGFVVLHSNGTYKISNDLLEPHVKEMREYLEKSTTVINWIHGHNKYIRFFIRNFVEPSKTLQRQHIVQIIEALRSILIQVHQETKGDSVAALKLKFPQILSDKEVLDAWVHSPAKAGGLNLYNPFLTLIPIHDMYKKEEEKVLKFGDGLKRFEKMVQADKREWQDLVEKSMNRQNRRHNFAAKLIEDTVTEDELFGYDYRYWEEIAKDWPEHEIGEDSSQKERMKKPVKKRVDFKTWCERTREARSSRWKDHYVELLKEIGNVRSQPKYDLWRDKLYMGQLKSKLGYEETEFVDSDLVPLSLISSMQEESVHKE